jgi:hypothetical protein
LSPFVILCIRVVPRLLSDVQMWYFENRSIGLNSSRSTTLRVPLLTDPSLFCTVYWSVLNSQSRPTLGMFQWTSICLITTTTKFRVIYRHGDDGRSLATGGVFALLLCVLYLPTFCHLLWCFLLCVCLHFGHFIFLYPLIHFRRSDWDILADGSNSACIPYLFPLPRFLSKFVILYTHSHSSHRIFKHTQHSSRVALFFFWSFCSSAPLYVLPASLKKSIKKWKCNVLSVVGGLKSWVILWKSSGPKYSKAKGRRPWAYDQTPLSKVFG